MTHTAITRRVDDLRAWMSRNGLDAFIFPSTDPHCGEYVADHWHTRQWISGFNGSAGTAVVTSRGAALWTDSRYWLAAEQQLQGTPFELIRCSRNVATPQELIAWIAGSIGDKEAAAVGVDAWTNTMESVEELDKAAGRVGMRLVANLDPAGELWADRPPLPANPVHIQAMDRAGRTPADKLADIRAALRQEGADALIVSLLDEIAWTLNLRGTDVHCTPLFVAYMLVMPDKAVLHIDPRKVSPQVKAHLDAAGVEVKPYLPIHTRADITIQYDPAQTNAGIVQAMARGHHGDAAPRFVRKPSPITPMKAVKNKQEIEGFRRAMAADGVAMVKFLAGLTPLDSEGPNLNDSEGGVGESASGILTEMGVDRRLTALRAEQPGFQGLSFDTIAAYGPHAAIVHYEATPETDIPLEPHGMMLLDSGAQYLDGTTDITRTIPLGPLTDDERTDYTLVLKGFLRLSMAVFPEGTTGTQLDVLARYALWQHHKNYGHGTGHGVGAFLSVHEGPHQFRMNYMPAPLQAGMTVTVEPGIYIAGSHGCRIENTMLIVEDNATDAPDAGCKAQPPTKWLRLEPLTLCPIYTSPIILSMLTPDERQYLNDYHARVRKALLPLLDDAGHQQWLIAHTQPVA